MNIIIINNTAAAVLLGDMGIYVEALQQLDITERFSLYEIRAANDLKDLCIAGSFSLVYNGEVLLDDELDTFFDYMSDYGLSLALGDDEGITYGDGPYTLSYDQFNNLQTAVSGGGSLGMSIQYELGENLSQGSPVYYNKADDNVLLVGTQLGNSSSPGKTYYNSIDMVGTDKFVVAYADVSNGSRGTVRVGQINGDNSITWGTSIVFHNASCYYIDVCAIDTNKFVVAFRGSSYYGQVRVGSISGTSITLGSAVTFNDTSTSYISCCKTSTNNFVVCYTRSNRGTARAASVSVLTPTFGDSEQYYTSSTYYNACWGCGVDHKFAVVYRGIGSRVSVCTVLGTEITVGTSTQWTSNRCYLPSVRSIDTNKAVVSYRDTSGGNDCKMVAFTVSGVIPTFGDVVRVSNSTSYYSAVCKQGTDGFMCVYTIDSGLYKGAFKRGSVSGTTITFQNEECFINNRIYYIDIVGINATKFVSVWYDSSKTLSYACVINGKVNTIPQFLGITTEGGIAGETKYVDLIGGVSATLSGLDVGEIYYITSSGTINKSISDYKAGKAVASDKLLVAVEGYIN